MKVFTMFSGVGAPEQAMRNLGLDWEVVGYSEIDKYAIQTYEKNFPGGVNYGDARTINETELPDFDMLIGGFPCQAFSVAGRRGGFADTRGTLFFDIARIAKHKRPTYLVLENVKGLLSHDSGKTFSTILRVLSETGYDVSWSIHNSKDYGVPQNRERIYIIGHLRGTPRPEVFPLTGTNPADHIIRTIRTGGAASFTEKHARDIIKVGTLRTYKDGNGFREMQQGVSPTIPARARSDGIRIRRLTPKECERLQGFPDGHTEGVSDTQRYKQMGNSMTVQVMEHVLGELIGKGVESNDS